ncbi:MAG: TetR/AcrR family transcriptional regulator [Rhizobiaceae bacterium]|nr:TetR/AcrR family transcriptional regulator [Rhizobiaceae bacterium]
MDDIIRTSGLSAGAVYLYFPSKEEIILAAVTTSLGGLAEQLGPLVAKARDEGPDWLVREVTTSISAFTKGDLYDLKRIALLGWSEAQTNQRLRSLMQSFYRTFRNDLAGCVPAWKEAGLVIATINSNDVAKSLLSIILGFVVQAALLGDVEPSEVSVGLSGLVRGKDLGRATKR